jgi:hypothetical protein
MLDKIKILQVNLNMSAQATEATLQLAIELKASIIAVQEPWLIPTRNSDYSKTRSVLHSAYTQFFPPSNPLIRPRVLFYISRTLEAEIFLRAGFTPDLDAMALVVKGKDYRFNLCNIYNEKKRNRDENNTKSSTKHTTT